MYHYSYLHSDVGEFACRGGPSLLETTIVPATGSIIVESSQSSGATFRKQAHMRCYTAAISTQHVRDSSTDTARSAGGAASRWLLPALQLLESSQVQQHIAAVALASQHLTGELIHARYLINCFYSAVMIMIINCFYSAIMIISQTCGCFRKHCGTDTSR